jgi:hypothetical protein
MFQPVSALRSCIGDEGRPLGAGLQEQASNRLKLHGLRALVVSVERKGPARRDQVRVRETSASEPLMRCRKLVLMTPKLEAYTTPG